MHLPRKPLHARRLLGAVAAAALLVACTTEIAPPFEIEGQGSLEGRVFFDANADGLYDPLVGDQALSGVRVTAFERGTTRVIATTTTSTTGVFRFEGMPVGSHDLFVDPASLPQGVVCVNPVPVSVFRHETQFRSVNTRIACLIRIDEAKLRPQGEVVNVRGVVTMAPGQGRIQGDDMYIQDASGGIKIFGGALVGSNLRIGDLVDFSGTMAAFNQEFQLTSPTINERLGSPGAPTPLVVTTAQAAAAGGPPTHPNLGRLVRINAAQLMTTFSTGGGRNAIINDGSGAVELRFEPGVIEQTANINPLFTVGRCYNVVGIIGSFNGVAQVKPRTTADVQEAPCN